MGINSFIVGVPGDTPLEAYRLAIDITKKEHDFDNSHPAINEKHGFLLSDNDPHPDYDRALELAGNMIAHGNRNVEYQIEPALCLRYVNASNDIEYLFFGWVLNE